MAPNSPEKKFLIFRLQGFTYALDLDHVAEVTDPPKLSPIPLAPPCYRGALNFHGDIVAVIDLARLLCLSSKILPGKIVVLHQKKAALAFMVDTVVRIVSECEVSLQAVPETGLSLATLGMPDGEATLLDLATIIAEAESALFKNR